MWSDDMHCAVRIVTCKSWHAVFSGELFFFFKCNTSFIYIFFVFKMYHFIIYILPR